MAKPRLRVNAPYYTRSLAKAIFGKHLRGHGVMETPAARTAFTTMLLKSGDPAFTNLLRDLEADPDCSVATMLKHHGINYRMLVNAFRQVQEDESLMRTYDELPNIMDDIVRDARSQYRKCSRCKGTKVITEDDCEVECPHCDGKGKVYVMGDVKSRDQILTAVGLGGKGLQINTQVNTIGGGHTMEDVVGGARAAITPAKSVPVIPAEVPTNGG